MNWFGGALGLGGMIFVGYRMWRQSSEIAQFEFDGRVLMMVALAAVIYGSANLLLARAWFLNLRCLDADSPWKWALKAFGISQLAKYVPGNIFQFAGRQALGLAVGISNKVLAQSALIEILLLALSGCAWAGLTLSLFLPAVPSFLGPIASVIILLTTLPGLYHWKGRQAVYIFCYHMLFFAVSGFVFVLILNSINSDLVSPAQALLVGSAFILSWLIGFLTPGAPAGIGIREFVLTATLASLIAESDLLLAIVMGRVVTMLGDLGFFFLTSTIRVNDEEN